MNTKTLTKYILILWILAILVLWGWRFWHFVVQNVPLGYDPGLYRSYFIENINLLPDFSRNSLEPWIQKAFPPFLGMIVAVIYQFIGWSLDRFVTHGVAVQSVFVSLALYYFISARDKKVALVAALLSWISFVQYQVFWRNYMKQLLGMFFLLMSLGLRVRGRWWLSLPLVIALSVTHRPGLMVLAVLAIIRVIYQIWIRIYNKSMWITPHTNLNFLMPMISIWVISIISNMILYPWFITEQIARLFSQFLASVDTPSISQSRTAGGTFLTTLDLLETNGHILVFAIIGLFWSWSNKVWRRYQVAAIFGFLRVFGQFSFYQRMMWYMDLFWLVFAGYTLVKVREWKPKIWLSIGIVFFGLHAAIFSFWVEKTRRPIMMSEELVFFKTLPEILPDDAVVMNTDASYSPWLKWYAQRPTISPWLFHESKWNRSQREENRRNNTWWQKCEALSETYWDNIENLYIWQWSKQLPFDYEWADCLEEFRKSTDPRIRWILYKWNKN